MSIETKYFTASGLSRSNLVEFYEWMLKNSREYFDDYLLDRTESDVTILGFSKNNAKIVFTANTGTSNTFTAEIYLSNGIKRTINLLTAANITTPTQGYISRVVKTNAGIVMSMSTSNATTKYNDVLCISKTNTGNTGIISIEYVSSGTTFNAYSISLENSIEFNTPFTVSPTIFLANTELTSFCVVPCIGKSTEYFPNILITPFYKYKTGMLVDDNGSKYFCLGENGTKFFVLKD